MCTNFGYNISFHSRVIVIYVKVVTPTLNKSESKTQSYCVKNLGLKYAIKYGGKYIIAERKSLL